MTADRKSYIGGSDVAALLGLSRWRTPLQVWLEKTGRETYEPDAAAQERMRWGTVLEDVIAREYARLTVRPLQRIRTLLVHPEVQFAAAHLDRVRLDRQDTRARWTGSRIVGADAVVEIKTASERATGWGTPGTDEIPDEYILQVQWYMGIARLPIAIVPVLFGGQRMEEYIVRQDAGLFASTLEEVKDWWQRHVVTDVPPPPTSEAEVRALYRAHNPGKSVTADESAIKAVERMREIAGEIEALENERQSLRDIISALMLDAEELRSPTGERLVTYRANKPSLITDWRAALDALAKEKGATLEEVARVVGEHTKERPGARVFRLINNPKE